MRKEFLAGLPGRRNKRIALAIVGAHACLLAALKIERVAAIGGSAGAPSAMQLCLRHPEMSSAVVLLFPIAFAPGHAIEASRPLHVRDQDDFALGFPVLGGHEACARHPN